MTELLRRETAVRLNMVDRGEIKKETPIEEDAMSVQNYLKKTQQTIKI
jgi:DNA/RNA endonuclease YhcR with UshA esterase domain